MLLKDNEKLHRILSLVLLPFSAFATDIEGTWKAEFDTQIGLQKYTFTLKQEGNSLTGQANSEMGGENYESKLKDGKVSGKEMKLSRRVGGFATEDLLAKLDAPAANSLACSDPSLARRTSSRCVASSAAANGKTSGKIAPVCTRPETTPSSPNVK